MLHSLRAEYLNELFGTLLYERIIWNYFVEVHSPLQKKNFVYSITYLYQHRLMDIHFISWVLLWCFFPIFLLLIKLFQLGPWLLFQLASVSLWHSFMTAGFCFVFWPFFPGIIRCSRLILYISHSSLEWAISTKRSATCH